MAEIDLPQAEADSLIAMEKHRINEDLLSFPRPGERLGVPLQSSDRRETFMLDVTRSSVKLTKANFQNRARQVVILLRLDIDGAPHRNPDGTEVDCPHLHVYREGFGDKWAYPAPAELLPASGSLYDALNLFMARCNITSAPNIQQGLF
ncbi:MAG TPA: hypothetical protein VII58_04230 [Acidobacteriaceae bacterium]